MTVEKIEVGEAIESLATYVRKLGSGPLVVTDEGRPVPTLILLDNADLETISLSTDPDFLELIQRSRSRETEKGGLSAQEVRRQLKAKKSL